MRRYKKNTLMVRGKQRKLTIDEDPRAIAYFTFENDEYMELRQKLHPITYVPSQDVPVGPIGEISQLLSATTKIAKALMLLYLDQNLREQALPKFLSTRVGDHDAVMSGVGFDFFVGRHLERPMLLEAAAFGPEFASSSIMAEFLGMKSLERRLAVWWHNLVKPYLKGAQSLHFVTSFGDFNFTRENEHLVLAPYLRKQGIKVSYGPAESEDALQAEVLYIRAGLQFPHVWQSATQTKLWPKILAGDVQVIPPLGNNFFSSKFWHPILKNPEELTKRGVNSSDAKLIASHLPNVMFLDRNLLEFLRSIVSKKQQFFFKGIWNYGGYGTRWVHSSSGISEALREIGEMPIIVEEAIEPGFMPYDPDRVLPDRHIEVRVRVFQKGERITTMPPSVRVYYPGRNIPEDSLYVDSFILP